MLYSNGRPHPLGDHKFKASLYYIGRPYVGRGEREGEEILKGAV